MTKTKELRFFTEPKHPTDKHLGWVALIIDDIHNLFTEMELHLFQCFVFSQREDQFSDLAGRDMTALLKGGGIAEYKEEYLNIDFLYPLTQKNINDIKNRAKDTLKLISIKKESNFDLSRSDASMLEAIIAG
ncbi:MAG: hypothetical protein KAI40_03465 [Desulfobacterales bacterium]|nr:hypothetical protein [Desulfobacterales bacterium]